MKGKIEFQHDDNFERNADDSQLIADQVNTFWKASMYDHENEEEASTLERHQAIIRVGAEELLKAYTTE